MFLDGLVIKILIGPMSNLKLKVRASELARGRELFTFSYFFADATQTIRINCVFSAKITRLLLPALLRHTNSGTRTRSAIVNISSILAWTPCPFNPIYGATKAFNRAFSRALSAEYAQLGVDVLCVSPGLVQSQLTGLGRGSLLASDPQSTAEYALSALGMAIEVFPHPLHGITAIGAVVIGWLSMKIASLLTALLLRFLPKPPGIKVSRDFRVR